MNIWLIHPYAGGPNLGRHCRPYWLAHHWQREGHQALVITSCGHHLLHNIETSPGYNSVNDVNYWFLEAAKYKSNGFKRLYHMFQFGKELQHDMQNIINNFGKPDVIIASSPHPFYLLSVAKISNKIGAKFWLEVRDLWPISLSELQLISRINPIYLWLSFVEKLSYKKAEKVISLLGNSKEYMINKGLHPEKFIWIPNGVELPRKKQHMNNNLENSELTNSIKYHKKMGKKIIIYAGAMGIPNAVDVILKAADIISKQHEDYKFFMVGKGANILNLKAMAVDSKDILFFDEVSHEVAQSALGMADCAVISMHKLSLYDYGISLNKLFEYALYAPRVVIASSVSALKGLEFLITKICEPNNPSVLAHTITAAVTQSPNNSDYILKELKKFSYKFLASEYIKDLS